MKSSIAFALGLIVGLGLFAVFSFRNTPPTAARKQAPSAASTAHSSIELPTPAPSPPGESSLESALREINEAGMVVIPQEFIRFLSPSLFGSYPNPAVREVLKLDDREVSAFVKQQGILFQSIEAASGKHLQITESSNGVLGGVLPAFPEERQKMVDNYRSNLSASLDAESAALFANIDLAQALAFHTRGTREFAVKIIPIDGERYRMELKSEIREGAQVTTSNPTQTYSKQRLITVFPAVSDRLSHKDSRTP